MPHTKLENEIKAKCKKRRIILISCTVVLFLLSVLFIVLYIGSRTEYVYQFGPYERSQATYNNDFALCFTAAFLFFLAFLFAVILEFVFTKLHTEKVKDDYVTFYKGYSINIYVNGEFRDGFTIGTRPQLEATLSDGSKVIVALGKWTSYIYFSNGHPSFYL